MICLHCGKEISRNQYCVEKPAEYEARLALQFCRAKCARLYGRVTKDCPRPTLSLISAEYGRSEGVAVPKELPERDAARLAFARSMPCALCKSIQGVHSHHESPPGCGTMSGKTSDRNTLPLCFACHRLRHDKGREVYGAMDIEAVISQINEAYDKRGM